MKDDANPMVLAAHVAEIGHSLWLKTTSFFPRILIEREILVLKSQP